jgi:hypothetical protein
MTCSAAVGYLHKDVVEQLRQTIPDKKRSIRFCIKTFGIKARNAFFAFIYVAFWSF